MKLRLVQPLILLGLLLQLGTALPFPVGAPAYAAPPVTSLAGECREALEEDDGVPSFLKDRATLAEKFRDLESITSYPAEMHEKFDANIKVITDPEDAFAAHVVLVRNAKETIDIAQFILTTDRAGMVMVSELKAALLRGVNVRILVDSLGSSSSILGIVSDLKSLLAMNAASPGTKGIVQVVIFNPQMHLSATVKKWITKLTNLFRSPGSKKPVPNPTLNNRMHDKILAADLHLPDRAVAIMGGRGLEETYFPIFGYHQGTFRDLEVVVKNVPIPAGPFHLGDVLGAYYNSLYYHLGNKVLSLGFRNFLGRMARNRLSRLDENGRWLLANTAPLATRIERMTKEGFLETGFEPASLQFVHEAENALRRGIWRDDLVKDRFTATNPGSLSLSLREKLNECDESIDIVTPFAWFPPEEAQALRDWVDAKPTRHVRIVTASVATDGTLIGTALSDMELGPAFMTNPTWPNSRKQITVLTYGKLDDARYGGSVWYGRLHTKTYIFDRKKGLIGSSNSDPRSRYWSTESGFHVENSPTIIKQLLEDADQLASLSTEWGSPEWKAVQDHPVNRTKTTLKNIIGRIMRALKLSPLA